MAADKVREHFEQVRMRVGKIKAVKPHPKTNDLIVLVHLGNVTADRQVVMDLNGKYQPEELMGKEVIYGETEYPQIVEGIDSLGFILVAHKDGKPVIVTPEEEAPPGAAVLGRSNVETAVQEDKSHGD